MNAQPASVMHGRLADVLLPISRGNPLHLLDMVDRLTLLSLVGALVGVVLGGGVAWFVNERGRQVLVAQAAAQANDQVALGVLSRVTAADFEPPHTPAQLEDLRMRLAPMVSHIRRDGADIVGVQLVARDRTIVYADSPANIGSTLATAEQPLLASALEGQSSSRPGWLSSSPADATIRALYGQVLIVSVPIESEGSTLGAYLLELDPAATDSVRPVVWGIVAAVFGLTFSLALRGIPIRNRQQPNALEKAAAPKRAAMCAITQKQRLTPREQEVLRLLATTLTYQDMAAQLSVGEETIRSHVKSVLSKLGQPNRTQAVLVALKSGLLEMA